MQAARQVFNRSNRRASKFSLDWGALRHSAKADEREQFAAPFLFFGRIFFGLVENSGAVCTLIEAAARPMRPAAHGPGGAAFFAMQNFVVIPRASR